MLISGSGMVVVLDILHLYCLVVQAGFLVLDLSVEGHGFDPQPGQKVISIFSPVTSGAQRK